MLEFSGERCIESRRIFLFFKFHFFDNFFSRQAVYGDQENTLFIVIGVPENTPFEPLVRKEISEIQFHKISNLIGKGKLKDPAHVMVEPTIVQLKKWLKSDLGQQLRREAMRKAESESIFSSPALQGAALMSNTPESIGGGSPSLPSSGPNPGSALLAALHGTRYVLAEAVRKMRDTLGKLCG